MDNTHIKLAYAKAHLSQLAERAAAGETLIITKRGKPVMQLGQAHAPRKPVDITALQRLTQAMPVQTEDAGAFMSRIRGEGGY